MLCFLRSFAVIIGSIAVAIRRDVWSQAEAQNQPSLFYSLTRYIGNKTLKASVNCDGIHYAARIQRGVPELPVFVFTSSACGCSINGHIRQQDSAGAGGKGGCAGGILWM